LVQPKEVRVTPLQGCGDKGFCRALRPARGEGKGTVLWSLFQPGAGDGTRTRDNLLGRNGVVSSPAGLHPRPAVAGRPLSDRKSA